MSDAKKCDRCGKLYVVGNGNKFVCFAVVDEWGITGWSKMQNYDLCEDCMKSLLNWIKSGGKENETD